MRLNNVNLSAPLATDGSCDHPPCGEEFEEDWKKLDVMPLHGIGKTAPYFHNNSVATLEDVVIHYEEFFKRVNALFPPPGVPPLMTTDAGPSIAMLLEKLKLARQVHAG